MRKIVVSTLSLVFITACVIALYAGSKPVGARCIADTECESGSSCPDGVCVKKREFDFGSSGKTGNPCNIDADCIGSGRCVEGNGGRKACSGGGTDDDVEGEEGDGED